MKILLLLSAMAVFVVGHVFKVYRWKQFIGVYEKPKTLDLLNALSIGHTVNTLVPFRAGDFFRVYLSGKHLKNGYSLAIATVLADLYVDVITVGLGFLGLALAGVGSVEIQRLARAYALLSVGLIAASAIGFRFKKTLKLLVQKVSSIFNSRIELALLHTSYCTLSSLKDIFRRLNRRKFAAYTVGIWTAYGVSYLLFTAALGLFGVQVDVSQVYATLFSSNCLQFLIASWRAQGTVGLYPLLLLAFVLAPLIGIFIYVRLANAARAQKGGQTEDDTATHVLPQLNQNERLAFLETYFLEDEKRDDLEMYLKINRDVNILRDYSAGSNATTMLCINQSGTFFRKYAFGKDAVKLREQIDWLEGQQRALPLPVILKKNVTPEYCSYDMAYNPYAVGFFEYIHSAPMEASWQVLQNVLTLLQRELYAQSAPPPTTDALQKYIRDKVLGNLEQIQNGDRYLRALWDYDTLTINGVAYPNLKQYADRLSYPALFEIFRHDAYATIHGDLTVENIICTRDSANSFYIIDPNTGNLHESPFLDYSKMLQSLHGGYEFLMTTGTVNIDRCTVSYLSTQSSSYRRLYRLYRDYLFATVTRDQVRSIYYHEIVHWLRLMPYKIKKDPKRAVLFYAGMLIVIHDVMEMFPENVAAGETGPAA